MIYGLTRVRNESAIIKDTLNHLATFCDGGIIIYDDCSTDDTVSICEKSDKVIAVIRGESWDKNRERAECDNRGTLLRKAQDIAGPDDWFVYIDADERIEFDWNRLNTLSPEIVGVKMKLFDFYITPEDVKKHYSKRKWIGPEYRIILMAYRNLPTLTFDKPDQREVTIGCKGSFLMAGYVKHYGKAISVEQWEETCDYYSTHFQAYRAKWEARKGKAVKKNYKSDFGLPLIRWKDRGQKGVALSTVENKKFTILIGTHHLKAFAGSEMFALTLARKLGERGHNVIIYAKYIDPELLSYCKEKNLLVTNNIEEIKKITFDIGQIQHNIIAYEVRNAFPDLPLCFISHGVLPFLESPPVLDLDIAQYLAVSEEVRENLICLGIPRDQIELYRNIIDTDLFEPKQDIKEKPQKALVISARLNDKIAKTIREACARLNISTQFIGGNNGYVKPEKVSDLINQADLVFSLGRGAMEAMLCGRIPIIYDYQGGDGLLTPELFYESVKNNFSGRRYARHYSIEDIIVEINKYKNAYGQILREQATVFFSHPYQIERILQVYMQIINEPVKLKEKDRARLVEMCNIIATTKNYSESEHSLEYKNTTEPEPEKDLSIIIPLYNNLQFTHQCLKSILKNIQSSKYEIICINNNSTDGTEDYLNNLCKRLINLKIITNETKKTTIECYNAGAEVAEGKYLLFLQQSFLVEENCCSIVMDTYIRSGGVGVVLPRMLNEEGKIIEAGGSQINNNSILSTGAGFSEDEPSYNYKKTVSLMSVYGFSLPREIFQGIGGLDIKKATLESAFLELGRRVMETGQTIVYQPLFTLRTQSNKKTPKQKAIIFPTVKSGQRSKVIWPINKGKPNITVLVVGIYLAEKTNHIEKIVKEIHTAEMCNVIQIWVAIGNNKKYSQCVQSVTRENIHEFCPKFSIINSVLDKEDLSKYDYILIIDDDVLLPKRFLDHYITIQKELNFALAQPARTLNSYIDHNIVAQQSGLIARQTQFVEIGPVFSIHASAYDLIIPFDKRSPMGWGYENIWAKKLIDHNLKMGIIDITPVDHSLRPPVANYNWDTANRQRNLLLQIASGLKTEDCKRVVDTFCFDIQHNIISTRMAL